MRVSDLSKAVEPLDIQITETGEYIQRGRTQDTETWYRYNTEGQGGGVVSEHDNSSSTIENTVLSFLNNYTRS